MSATLRLLCALACLTTPVLAHPVLAHDGPAHGELPHGAARGVALDRSVQQLATRVAAHPDDTVSLSKLAVLQLRVAKSNGEHEDYQAAARSFARLAELDAGSRTAGIGRAYALLGQHRFAEALGHARLAAESAPDSTRVWALIGDLHFALGNYVEAELAYQRLHAAGLTLQSFARLAQIHQQRGRVDEARRSYELALEAGELLGDPPSAQAWCRTMLGDLALERGDRATAARQFDLASSLDPDSHAVRLRLAHTARLDGDLERAEHLLRELAGSHPRPHYWLALASLLDELGLAPEARDLRGLAEQDMRLDLSRGDIGHTRELAEFYLSHGTPDQRQRAVALARQDLAEVRHDSRTHETLAWALHTTGQHADALTAVRNALRPGPESVRLLCRAALIHEHAGQSPEARQLLHLAAAEHPPLSAELHTLADPSLPLDLTGPILHAIVRAEP